MKLYKKAHSIDLIFPLLLLLLFCFCAFMVTLEGAGIYEQTTAGFQKNYTVRTACTYLQEKIRECGDASRVEVKEMDGRQVLILSDFYGEEMYASYIYLDQGTLKELFIKKEEIPDLDAGQELMPLDSFEIDRASDHLFRFRVTYDGQEETTWVSLGSGEKG